MSVAIPSELEFEVVERARQRHVDVEDIVREALDWYLRVGTDTLDELTAWQDVRDEALQVVEGPAL
jgi:predicted nucleic-acid-binding protein